MKTFGSLVFAFFILQGADETGVIQFSISNYTAAFDGLFVALMGSGILFLVTLEIQKFVVLQGLRSEISSRFRIPGFSAEAALFLDGHEELMPAIPVLPYSFLRESFPISGFTSALTLIVFLGLMAPLPYIWNHFFLYGISEFNLDGSLLFGALLPLTLILFLVASPLFLLLTNIPIPMKKNADAIRWGFLFPHGRYVTPPQLKKWIDSDK